MRRYRWCSGHSLDYSCDSAVIFWTYKSERYSSLAAKRLAETLIHVVFFSTKHQSQARDLLVLLAAAVCTLAWYVTTQDARWVHCSSSLGPSSRRPTASCSVAAGRRDVLVIYHYPLDHEVKSSPGHVP